MWFKWWYSFNYTTTWITWFESHDLKDMACTHIVMPSFQHFQEAWRKQMSIYKALCLYACSLSSSISFQSSPLFLDKCDVGHLQKQTNKQTTLFPDMKPHRMYQHDESIHSSNSANFMRK